MSLRIHDEADRRRRPSACPSLRARPRGEGPASPAVIKWDHSTLARSSGRRGVQASWRAARGTTEEGENHGGDI